MAWRTGPGSKQALLLATVVGDAWQIGSTRAIGDWQWQSKQASKAFTISVNYYMPPLAATKLMMVKGKSTARMFSSSVET
jgi:hypothetical protein